MKKAILHLAVVVTGFITSPITWAQSSLPSLEIIEKRNAATVFVSVREQFAFSLVRECMPHLSQANPDPLTIVKAWYGRNFAEIEAALVWLNQYLVQLRSQNPQLANAAQQAFLQESSKALLENARAAFAQQLPDAASCGRALSFFTQTELDFAHIGKQPGFSQFSEFSQTLREYKSSSAYQVPSNLRFGVTDSQLAASQMVASMIAADAAQKARDASGFLAAHRHLALQGDGKAAQTIGISYLNGDLLPKDILQAYRWFYAAFQLADYEGANALGVMHRDGLIRRGNDKVLAQASFALGWIGARTTQGRDRALNNFNRMDMMLTSEEKHAVSCLRLAQIDENYKTTSEGLPILLTGITLRDPQRRLRELMPNSLSSYRSEKPCD
ncbi:MAG: hypothetical protein ACKO1L_03045 [Brachymonas sp.]